MFTNAQAFSSFSVDDLEKAKAFYGETLELQVEETPMQTLRIEVPGVSLMVYPKGPAHTPATFTVLNFKVENIDEAVDALIAKGITCEQYHNEYMQTDEKGISRMPDGPSMAWFKDPAGNILSVIQEK